MRLTGILCSLIASLLPLSQAEEDHWSFQPLTQPAVPSLDDPWVANAIDAFVLDAMRRHGLSPSEPADGATLVRRAAHTLTGLQPSDVMRGKPIDEVLDALLASPAYGERWGRHWLDVARYSDAKGYVDAGEARYPFSYTYRDYVIRAFNDDLRFDRFVLEQVAADHLVVREDDPAWAALGFLTIGSRFNFFPHDIIDDRIDVVTRGILGLSVACARCHDHKYDPVSTEDYYGLYSIFANSREPHLGETPPLEERGLGEDAEFQEKLSQAVEEYQSWRAARHEQVVKEMCGWAGDYLHYIVQTMPEHRTEAQPALQTERGLVREVSAYSSGGVHRWRTFLQSRTPNDAVFGLWVRLVALDRDEIERRWREAFEAWCHGEVEANALVVEAFEEGAPIRSMADVAQRYAEVLEEVDRRWRRAGDGALEDEAAREIHRAMVSPGGPGDITLHQSEDFYTLGESTKARELFAKIERVFLSAGAVAPRPMSMVDRGEIVEQRVFVRGDARNLGKRVPRAVPGLLRGLAGEITEGSGRRELAQMMVHPENPLTARVIANRVWGWHFGRGLVDTPSDFGVQGSEPSHPELLDYLAAWLRENEWSLKKLHRLILTSNTWRQSSNDREACRRLDPENRYYWRMNRQRLSFEAMRDSLLQVSGNLDRRQFGPPVRQRPDALENRRRTVYTHVDREKLEELFRVFDFPSPDITAPQRLRTTVPQQSLFLLNSSFVFAQAERLVRLCGQATSAASASELYTAVYGRPPDAEELELMLAFIAREGSGSTRAWNQLAQTLLLANAFQFVD